MNPEIDQSVTNCGNCHLPMPRQLRFCRNCGFRLGEGPAEYTETVRFQDVPKGFANNSAGAYGLGGGPIAVAPGGPIKKRRKRMSGMSWLFIGLLFFFVAAAGFTTVIRQSRRPDINVQFGDRTSRALSFVGESGFETTDGGVTFDNVEPPGSPADKAGLVGGDIITSFDGHPVQTDDEMAKLLRQIPSGKTVDVVFLRDSVSQTTKLTTVSEAEFERLQEEYENRPGGRPLFGYEDRAADRVPVPDTKIFGVRLGEILSNRPADIAGVKEGDIVIQFNDTPIRTTDEFLARVRRAEPYSTVTVVVMRGAEKITIPVKVGKQ